MYNFDSGHITMLRILRSLPFQCSKIKLEAPENDRELIEVFAKKNQKLLGMRAIWGESIFDEIRNLN